MRIGYIRVKLGIDLDVVLDLLNNRRTKTVNILRCVYRSNMALTVTSWVRDFTKTKIVAMVEMPSLESSESTQRVKLGIDLDVTPLSWRYWVRIPIR